MKFHTLKPGVAKLFNEPNQGMKSYLTSLTPTLSQRERGQMSCLEQLTAALAWHAKCCIQPKVSTNHRETMPKKILVAFLYVHCCFAQLALAEEERQSLAGIRQAVVEFLASKMKTGDADYKIEVAMPDSRLELSRCGQPLDVFVQSGGIDKGTLSVGVRCPDEVSWSIYTLAQVKQFRKVVVLTRAVDRGAAVTPDDLAIERHDITRLRQGYLTSFDEALNMRAKRPLSPGSILNHSLLEHPKLVRRGQTVAIVAQSAMLDIRTNGKALMDGTAGERISVRNEKSSRIVEGVVAAPGLVRVAF